MHPRIREVLDFLDTRRAELELAVNTIPEDKRETSPAAERWSAAQVVEHLTMVEGRVDNLIITQLSAARAAGLAEESESSPVTPTLDVAGFLDRSQRIEARENSQPTAGLSAESAMAKLNESRAALRAAVKDAAGLALGSVMMDHPRLGPLNVYQWLLFLGAHEERHVLQIKELAASL